MRKFKIKNRRKRKYVKKNDLAAMYSSVQSLTVGFVPLILMAIAFLTTTIMYNPPVIHLSSPVIRFAMPEVTFPKITIPEATFVQPQLPTISLPKITLPEIPTITLPRVTLPNPIPFITTSLTTFSQFISTSVSLAVQGVSTAVTGIFEACGRLSQAFIVTIGTLFKQIALAITNSYTATVQFITLSIRAVTTVVINTAVTIANASAYAFSVAVTTLSNIAIFIQQAAIKIFIMLVNAWNAFIWFIGTPFRSLHAYSVELGIALAPYIQYISKSFEQSSDGLRKGGETLMNGTVYVSNTIEHNQNKK